MYDGFGRIQCTMRELNEIAGSLLPLRTLFLLSEVIRSFSQAFFPDLPSW
jgi:hypothetical protein